MEWVSSIPLAELVPHGTDPSVALLLLPSSLDTGCSVIVTVLIVQMLVFGFSVFFFFIFFKALVISWPCQHFWQNPRSVQWRGMVIVNSSTQY